MSQPFLVEGGTRLATQPDGTTTLLYPINPVTNGWSYPQVVVGEIAPLGQPQAPFVPFPTDTANSFSVQFPDVALGASQGVVAFSDWVAKVPQDVDDYVIGFQFIDTNGLAFGPRMQAAHTYAWMTDYVVPRVAMNRAGQFAIVWFDQNDWPPDSFVRVQVFDVTGQPIGTNIITLNDQPRSDGQFGAYNPVVAVASDGSSVCAWEDAYVAKGSIYSGFLGYDPGHDIYARRVDAMGNPVASQFRVNTTVNCGHSNAEMAMATNGAFVIAWQQSASEADGIYCQRFDSDGNPSGPQLSLSPYNGTAPKVAMAGDGRFIVVWQAQDDDGSGVFAQRFMPDGSFFGNALWLNEGATNSQTSPLVGIADDGTFIVKWSEGTNDFARWISWDATNQAQILGPRVQSMVPAYPVANTISNVAVTFDRLMDPSTFHTNYAQLVDPVGRAISITSVQTTDNLVFTLGFPTQHLPGRYHLRVGPNIADLSGALMDENGNTLQGEPADAFFGQFVVTNSAPASFPVVEGFEGGPDSLIGWSFDSVFTPGSVFTTDNAPHGGSQHLSLVNNIATLAVDLSSAADQTNLFLSFWAKGYVLLDVEFSVDGQKWCPIVTGDLSGGTYTNYLEYAVALNPAAISNGISLSGRVYVRFGGHSGVGASLFLDDVQIAAGTLPAGPRVTALAPSLWPSTNSALNMIGVVFDQAIDPTTIPNAIVSLKDPLGSAVNPVSVFPAVGSGNTEFVLTFPDQVIRGDYQLILGPGVASAAGHLLNQNGDAANGSPNDYYSGLVTFAPQPKLGGPGPIVFEDTFENWPPAPANWSFEIYPYGGAGLSNYEPYRGTNCLSIAAIGGDTSASVHTGTAILAIDLSEPMNDTNLFLQFWARDGGSGGSDLSVEMSDNSQDWHEILYAMPTFSYTPYTIDLRQAGETNGVSLAGVLWLRFRVTIPVNLYPQVGMAVLLDDVRILAGNPGELVPPMITGQPQSVYAQPGTNVVFTVAASGTLPLSYQWLFQGSVMPGETNSTLSLTNVGPLNNGDYQVVVSNAFGVDTSTLAILGGLNDQFTNRVPIPGTAATVRGSNLYATRDPGEPNYSISGKSVWWTWSAPATGKVVISTTGSSFDTMLRIFTGSSVSNLFTIATDDNSGGGKASRVSFVAQQGVEYQIDVEGYLDASGTIVLNLAFSTNWPAILVQPQSQTATANTDCTFSVTAMGAEPLAYQWQCNGRDLPGATDSNLTIYKVQPTNAGNYSVVVTNAYGSDSSASATLTVIVRPPNDNFADRIVLTGGVVSVTGSNVNATMEPGEPYHYASTGGKSVWWTWTAPASGPVTIDTIGSSFDTILAVYTNTVLNNLTRIASDDDSGGNHTSRVSFNAPAGTIYQIAVDGYGGASGQITLNVLQTVLTLGSPLRLTNGLFQFQLIGQAGTTNVIQVSTNLAAWSSILTDAIPVGGVLVITDPASTNWDKLFYRALAQ